MTPTRTPTPASTGSFSAAARTYGVTQPALSNGIAKLEERLGERMFDRSTRGVTRTAFGSRILPLIDRALAELDAITAEARRLTEPGKHSIHMGVSPLIDAQLVARAFVAVCELPEPRDLVLREANMKELREGLLTGVLDVILIPSVEPLSRFEHRIIDSEPVVVVDSTPAGSEPIELGDAADDAFILVPDSCGLTTFTTQLFDEHGLPMNTYPGEASSYRVLEQWANLGLGAAILPKVTLPPRGDPNTYVLRITDPSLSRTVCINTLRGHKLSPASLKLVRLLKELIPDADERPGTGRELVAAVE